MNAVLTFPLKCVGEHDLSVFFAYAFSLEKFLFYYCFILKGREGERECVSEIFHLLAHCPNSHSNGGWNQDRKPCAALLHLWWGPKRWVITCLHGCSCKKLHGSPGPGPSLSWVWVSPMSAKITAPLSALSCRESSHFFPFLPFFLVITINCILLMQISSCKIILDKSSLALTMRIKYSWHL